MLRGSDGKPFRGGANTSAVRLLPSVEFSAIVDYGLGQVDDVAGMSRRPDDNAGIFPAKIPDTGYPPGMSEAQSIFETPELASLRKSILISRPFRDASFARQVKRAYANRCAMSGLALTNGGGRPEVEAAHIRPVKDQGPDTVRNGIALSGTLHWMFDRGLLGVGADHTILISHNKVPQDVVQRLIRGERKLVLPKNPRHQPHPAFLEYHRENIFGQLQ